VRHGQKATFEQFHFVFSLKIYDGQLHHHHNRFIFNGLIEKTSTCCFSQFFHTENFQSPSANATVFILSAAMFLGQHINSYSRIIHSVPPFEKVFVWALPTASKILTLIATL